MSLERRLNDLEARASRTDPRRESPIEVRVLLKAVARHQARERGEELPAYTEEELEEMRREDLDVVAGGGAVGQLRDSPGWREPEAQTRLDEWEEDARRRLRRIEYGESLEVVYEHDEDEEIHEVDE